MSSLRDRIISNVSATPTIDPAAEIDIRVGFLVDYLDATGARGLVLGISGGQDSTLAGRLCQLAVERRRAAGADATFWAVRLPYQRQIDEADAQRALEFIAPDRALTINIGPASDVLEEAVAGSLGAEHLGDFNRGNLKARVRMTAQYALAGEVGALVVGTDHAAENVTAFFTKFGDGASDLMPLAGLTKGQGARLLDHLGAPESTWTKIPTADLEDDRPAYPDEEALGVSYRDIDAYLEGRDLSAEAAQRIEELWKAGEHKRRLPTRPQDTWWR